MSDVGLLPLALQLGRLLVWGEALPIHVMVYGRFERGRPRSGRSRVRFVLFWYRVPPLAAKRFSRDHFLAARGLAATRRRHDRGAGATVRATYCLFSRDSSPFALGDLKRAQAGWPGVTNSAQALQQCTVVSAAVHAALAHRDHAERLQWCRDACRECVAAHTRRADASLMLTATRCSALLDAVTNGPGTACSVVQPCCGLAGSADASRALCGRTERACVRCSARSGFRC